MSISRAATAFIFSGLSFGMRAYCEYDNDRARRHYGTGSADLRMEKPGCNELSPLFELYKYAGIVSLIYGAVETVKIALETDLEKDAGDRGESYEAHSPRPSR